MRPIPVWLPIATAPVLHSLHWVSQSAAWYTNVGMPANQMLCLVEQDSMLTMVTELYTWVSQTWSSDIHKPHVTADSMRREKPEDVINQYCLCVRGSIRTYRRYTLNSDGWNSLLEFLWCYGAIKNASSFVWWCAIRFISVALNYNSNQIMLCCLKVDATMLQGVARLF